MKILIVIACELCKAPYVKYYTDIFDADNIEYDIASWDCNVNNDASISYTPRGTSSKLAKVLELMRFSRYVKKVARKNKYDLVLVHTIVPMVFLSDFLNREFRNRFILDIRDYSKILDFKCLKNRFLKVLSNASLVSISSDGFRKWLPTDINYCLSHNISQEVLNSHFVIPKYDGGYPIKISTLGLISYYNEDIQLIDSLGNNSKFELSYYGYGAVELELRKFVKDNNYNNVSFYGRYKKEDEKKLYNGASFISCYCPNTFMKSTVMSNRFYLALLSGIPLIATTGSIQSDILKEYNVGVSISADDNIELKLIEYYENFDKEQFQQGRIELIRLIKSQNIEFVNRVITTYKK